jgi:hypothetical protein
MASSYTKSSWGHPVGYWYYTVQEDNVNVNNNTSRVTVNFYVQAVHNGQKSQTYNHTNNTSATIWINGTQITYRSPAKFDIRSSTTSHGYNNFLGSASATITHDSNGAGSYTVTCSHYCGNTTPSTVTISGTHYLQKINKPAPPPPPPPPPPRTTYHTSLSIQGGIHNLGNNVQMTFSGYSSTGAGLTHYIWFQLGNNANYKVSLGPYNNGTHNINLPASWKRELLATHTENIPVHLDSYSGGNYVASDSKTMTIKNPDIGGTLSLPGGTHNIGAPFSFTLNTDNDYMSYTIQCYTNKNPNAITHSSQVARGKGSHSIKFNEIPWNFKTGVSNQGTDIMTVRVWCFHKQIHVTTYTATVTIKNDDYQLYFNDLYIDANKTYEEKGKHIAGKTAMVVNYSVTSTFDIKRVEFKMTGANSNYGGWDWPGKSNAWNSGICYGLGDTWITCTVTDTAGHTASKQIYCKLWEEEKHVTISEFVEKNKTVYIKKADTNGKTKFKFYVKWSATGYKYKINFNMSGKNSQSHQTNWITDKYYTWETGDLYQIGESVVKVTVTNDQGVSDTETINVKVLEEAASISVDNSYVDSKLCVDLVKGLLYKDYSRIGLTLKVDHTHRLNFMTITINDREFKLTSKDIDPEAFTFTFVDNKKIEKLGTVSIKIYAEDVNGKSDSVTLSAKTYAIIEKPKIPTIEYESNKEPLFLSEGEKVVFTGESTSLKDYQVVYAIAPCDVFTAMKNLKCDDKDSYIGVEKTTLKNQLIKNTSTSVNYYILKDFNKEADTTFITQDSSKKNKFHIHPTSPNHSDNFYALQFLNKAKPGDMIYIYVIERKMGTFDKWLYSTDLGYNEIAAANMFKMCVIPPAPCRLSIYKQEQTSDKIVIQYANPLYGLDNSKTPIHLIDVCLIAKDKSGNLLNTSGTRSKSENRKRDGLYGKTWLYYTERKWHNIVPSKASSYNNAKILETIFDISKYPKGTNFNIVAFYYTDFYNHPSIYSTSNLLTFGKSNLPMTLKITSPANGSNSNVPNPTVKVRVSTTATEENSGENSIYENYNLATKWDAAQWEKNPIWFRVPRTQDSQVPNFRTSECDTTLHPYKDNKEAKHSIEYYYTYSKIYTTTSLFRISGKSVNDDGIFKENALYLKSNNNNQVYIGDIETYSLLEKGYLDFTWTQKSGRFLSIGDNKIEAFTSPYIYDKETIDYDELNGYWLSNTLFYSNSIMPFNPFRNTIIKPATETWDNVESTILSIKIPYKLLNANTAYDLTFSYFADTGFKYEKGHTVSNNEDLANLCSAIVFLDVDNKNNNLISLKYSMSDIIYRPQYTFIGNNITESPEVNNYNKWRTSTISFTSPNATKLESLDDANEFITINITARGINILKLKDLKLVSSNGKHIIDMSKGKTDETIIENKTSITVSFVGSITVDFGYLNPLLQKDMIDFRTYLEMIANYYKVTVKATWRDLIKDQHYLMANDYNDAVKYCIDLFTAIQNKYPRSFKGNIEAFRKLPTIKKNDARGPKDYSIRGNHYFPEWDDLIDAIKLQTIIEEDETVTDVINSKESATWSTSTNAWEGYNNSVKILNTELKNNEKPDDSTGTTNQVTVTDCSEIHLTAQKGFFHKYVIHGNSNEMQIFTHSNVFSDAEPYNSTFENIYIYYFFSNDLISKIRKSKNEYITLRFYCYPDQRPVTATLDIHPYSSEKYMGDNIVKVNEDAESVMYHSVESSFSHAEIYYEFKVPTSSFIDAKTFKGVRLRSLTYYEYVNLTNKCVVIY